MTSTVLILGADGFIGRHIAFALRQAGFGVIASARRTSRLSRMGFDTLRADLSNPATHDPEFWRPHVENISFVVNCAGILTGSKTRFQAVHVNAPSALYRAMPAGSHGILLSAVGLSADTDFARYRLLGEDVAAKAGITVLRAGLVLADTSYGGSSLMRALAVMPFATPIAGDAEQVFNPIHARDLANVIQEVLQNPQGPEPIEIGGPERVTQGEMLRAYRNWFGLPPVRQITLPGWVATAIGRLGDALNMGPVSSTSLAQMSAGVQADEAPLLSRITSRPRGFSTFLWDRPAATQDLWQARLYLLRPVVRMVLAVMWLMSGVIGLALAPASFVPLFDGSTLNGAAVIFLARLGGGLDLMIGLALLRNWRPRMIGLAQLAMVAGYSIGLSALAPALWLAPMGGVLKNLPVLALIALHMVLGDER